MGYPCWRYHRTEPAVIVNDAVEEAALGDGWADTPAKFLVGESIIAAVDEAIAGEGEAVVVEVAAKQKRGRRKMADPRSAEAKAADVSEGEE